ncbi:MAG: flagellar hook-basal body complex protein FliE [Cyanobacteria bacterium REEB65]|nr:flagellar hook-basal body complex protein FliE [Cyanobacteria bacterium REEB65]
MAFVSGPTDPLRLAGLSTGGVGGASSGQGFNALFDSLAPAGHAGDPEFGGAIVPPATSLDQPANWPDMPAVGPGAPGPVSSSGKLFKPLADWLGEVNAKVNHATDLEQTLATGGNVDLHDVMVASEEAGIAVSLVTQIRNKALEAFNDIIHMQV